MAVIDTFTYNGERDLLRIHLATVDKYVDKFVICEAKTTFTRHPKPLYFFRDQRFFRQWWHKIEYHVIDEDYSPEEIALAKASPNTSGAAHWTWEFLQKESIHKALRSLRLKDDDIVFIGDVDEIWDRDSIAEKDIDVPYKLKLRVYAYYLNNRSNEQFWGTIVSPYGEIKDKVLNHVRSTNHFRSETYHGWHFTSQGGLKEVQRKLNDSYTPESYNTPEVQNALPERIKQGTDYLGRDFTFHLDESDWPQYLKENRHRYEHLLKGQDGAL